ncbi:MAG: beta-lactamase family protein [Proteobacteria bacterium]|nr:beta-lactamase family protein [Pseudomonadota bacterium]
MTKFLISLFFLTALISTPSGADELDDKLNQLLLQFLQQNKTPGLSVSIGHNNKILWSKGFGYADLEQRVQVDPALTKFRVGSIAKPFTAFALAKLLEAGKIGLDAEIHAYVPSFPQKNYPISIRQLAGHLSGIRHYANDEMYNRSSYTGVVAGLAIFQNDPLLYRPGEKWLYTSYGYNLLSAAIEKASGKNFLDYMSETVFLPLGMTQTGPDHLQQIIPHRGRYYLQSENSYSNEPEVDNSYKWASGGFLSTSDDLVRFGLAHLNNRQLKQNTINILWTPQKTTAGESTEYGIGWRVFSDNEGQKWVGHGGGSIGGTTQFWLYPEHGLVIAAISNLSDMKYAKLIPDLNKLLIQQLALNPE